jgi:hypothetical protein
LSVSTTFSAHRPPPARSHPASGKRVRMPRREHLANAAIKLGAAHCFQDERRGRRRSPTAKQPGSMPPDLPDCNPATFHEIPLDIGG